MEKRDKEVIKGMYVTLTKELDVGGYLVNYLFQENVLDVEHMEKIKAKKTPKKKREKLLKILYRRENGLRMLIKALYNTHNQHYLASALLRKVAWSDQEKSWFEDELQGNISETQVLELKVTGLKQKISTLEQENEELKLKLAEVLPKGDFKEVTSGTTKHSDPSSSKTGKIFGKLFRKQIKYHDTVGHGDSTGHDDTAGHDDTSGHDDNGYELFSELDFTVIVQISNHLTSTYTWSKLGEEFGMDPHTLRAMESNLASSRAEMVLLFIKTACPNLTVPQFREVNESLGYQEIVELLSQDRAKGNLTMQHNDGVASVSML